MGILAQARQILFNYLQYTQRTKKGAGCLKMHLAQVWFDTIKQLKMHLVDQ